MVGEGAASLGAIHVKTQPTGRLVTHTAEKKARKKVCRRTHGTAQPTLVRMNYL